MVYLLTWIMDYLYIPLGGNRLGARRTYLNLLICFMLSGLWHGAKLTFIAWGAYQAIFLILERFLGKRSLYSSLPKFLQIVATNIIVLFGWVLFRSPDLGQAVHYWKAMLGMKHPYHCFCNRYSVSDIIEMIICAIFMWQTVQAHNWIRKLTPVRYAALSVIFLLAVAMMFSQSFNPFLYFQF